MISIRAAKVAVSVVGIAHCTDMIATNVMQNSMPNPVMQNPDLLCPDLLPVTILPILRNVNYVHWKLSSLCWQNVNFSYIFRCR